MMDSTVPVEDKHPRESSDGNSVVISGMAGLYPQARYVKDLENILYNKLNPVTAESLRWKYNHPEVSQALGSVPDLDRFDAQFFKVHHRLGKAMDSMSRKLLEQSYEAIYDAGINPETLSGKKIGVFIGSCFSETEKIGIYKPVTRSGFGICGCNKSMFANRISYWLNTKGPSYSIDQACCSSIAALEAAYGAISREECEAAIVGGANLCLHPQSLVHHGRIMNSITGTTKSFSEDAAGCAKSEAINVIFLQKAKDANRIYAEVVHVKSEFVSIDSGESGPKYGFCRNPTDTARFLQNFYREAGVDPALVEFVEAFGSATPEADKSELEAIDKVFCNGREKALPVGSVMSNIGYGEAASGLSSITKVLLGFQKGVVAGNLHGPPRRDVAALREERVYVATEDQRIQRTYIAVNSMSVTGVNAHVLLHGRYKAKEMNHYDANIPRLVVVSGRQEAAVERVLHQLASHPVDPEELALLHNIHETNIAGHLGKGYTVLTTGPEGGTESLTRRTEYCDVTQRPLWFVYSGMGSQWAGMGEQLMRIPIFAAAIQRCHKVLEPKGINIVEIITSHDNTTFDNILHSFVGIAAIQIGLTDILMQLELLPDKIIGHSVGELGCAYADGCLTAEEMVLSAYSRGRVSLDTPFIRGSMAAVGVGHRQMSSLCPPEIEIACHNSGDSCTISGPAAAMQAFVADLTTRGVFAKEVPCSNIAYHSRYIAEAGPDLLNYLREVIKTPRLRSDRWVSTSVPQDRWHEPSAKYSSAEYHTNNLLSPVLFEETLSLVPSNAVMVEVAPHGLLQAILRRALPSAAHVPLTRRGNQDVVLLLDAIGKLYLHGYFPKVSVLYPKVEFPVSTGTPLLSHYVEWAHQDKWSLPLYQTAHRTMTGSCKFVTSIYDDNCYLQGHVIGGKTLLPFSYALVAAWDTLVMTLNAPKKSLNVRFKDVKFYSQPVLHGQKVVRLRVSLHRSSGWFEIMDEDSKVATGYIAIIKQGGMEPLSKNNIKQATAKKLNAPDIYRIFYDRGYAYSGSFRSIYNANSSISDAKVLWEDNWVSFIDGLIQLKLLKCTNSGIALPACLRRMVIDVTMHEYSIDTIENIKNKAVHVVDVKLSDIYDRISCGGVVIEDLRFRSFLQSDHKRISLQSLKFVPKFHSGLSDVPGEYYLPLENTLASNEIWTLQSSRGLDSLQWVPAPNLSKPGILVAVHYAGINIGDVYRVLGLTSWIKNVHCSHGMDFSGLTESGERVMGLVPHGAASTHVMAQPELMWPVPEFWTLEDAATVPFAYVYAYYCFIVKASVKVLVDEVQHQRPSVLVQGGAGALGQAAINLALARGWRVFATVGSLNKKRFLLRLFPELYESDIGNSRDISFGDMVLSATRGMGCHVIIGCLEGELKDMSLKCCAPSCVVIDTAHILNNENYSYCMGSMTDDRSYITTDITSIFSRPKDMKMLNVLVSEGIARGEVRPITRYTHGVDETQRAFRLPALRCHHGRSLLCLENFRRTNPHKYVTPRNFVILSNYFDFEKICIERAASGLPATFLNLSKLKTFQDADGVSWYRDASYMVERALKTNAPVLLALPNSDPRPSMLCRIGDAANLDLTNNKDSKATLEDLGMPPELSSTVCALLRDVYNVSFDEKDISQLTLDRLKQIENRDSETPIKEVKGLPLFFSSVDSDELLATTEMVFLPTLTNNYVMRDDEVDASAKFLCIVPGLEGQHGRFRALCERLKLPAAVLQPGLDHHEQTPRQLAQRYSKVLFKKTRLQNIFYILGYETGVIVALELAAILEEHGLTGVVFCLGDGPLEIQALLERELSSFPTEADLEDALTGHLFGLMAHGSNMAANVLDGCATWSERVDACMRALGGRMPYSVQYARATLLAARSRVAAARRALDTPRLLSSQLVLLRARNDNTHQGISYNNGIYGDRELGSLQCYSPHHYIHELSAPLSHVASDLRVPPIINSYLHNDVLQAFDSKNLCDNYLTNADAFMTLN